MADTARDGNWEFLRTVEDLLDPTRFAPEETSSSSWHDVNEAQPLACVLLEPQPHSFADPKYEILPGDIRAGVEVSTKSVAALNLQTDCRGDIPR
jgi:hypothetical protein